MKTIKLYLSLIAISLFFNSCFIDELGYSDSDITFITYWQNDIFNPSDFSNSIIVGNDTLSLRDLSYVISDLKLTSKRDTINITDYKLMKSSDNFNIVSFYDDVYKISFNFGIENLNKEYPQLKAQNYDIEDGYYFLKMKFKNKAKDSLYNYNIAKKNINSKVKSFKVTIDGFQPSNGYFVSQAVIGLNLKNLFIQTNQIKIDSLTPSSLDNEILQVKMIENAENIFFLKEFNYD